MNARESNRANTISSVTARRAALALALAALACSPPAPNLDSPGSTIVCFGDSITAGVGAAPEESYPQRLSETIGVEVRNLGVPGDTAGTAAGRIDQVLAQDPWLVIVELGGNDLLQRAPIAATEQALRQILDRLLAARVVPVLVEIEVPIYGGQYDDMFERLADDYDVPLVEDALRRILTDPALKSDTIHPNAAGYRQLAQAVAEEIGPLLRARRGSRR